jgi:hypothetical protein
MQNSLGFGGIMNIHRSFSSLLLTLALAMTLPRTFAVPQHYTPSLSPLAQQLLDLEKAFSDAQKRHDRDFVKAALTDDFVSISTDGEPRSKANVLSDVASDERLEYRIYNAQVVPLDDSAAVLTYDVIVRMVHYDEDTPRYQRVSSVWVKQGDDWKLKFQQATATEQHH